MRSRSTYALILSGAMLFACSDNGGEKVEGQEVEEVVAAVADSQLELSVEGMVCAHACGGSIKKALKATGAVEKVTINFEEERPSNNVVVLYDSKKINKGEIEKIITELNNGQFTSKEISDKKLDNKVSEEKSEQSSSDRAPGISAVTSGFEIPNIFEILSGLIL